MSEGSNNGKPNGQTENQENLDPEKLKATNERLLKESQEYKRKYQAALQEKEELEAKKLADSGDKDAMLAAEKKKAEKALEELRNAQKKVINHTVKEKITKYAGDVYNVEELMIRPKLKEFLKEGLDKDNLDFSDDVAKRYVEETKKEAPYLWKTAMGMGVNTHRAGSSGTTTGVDTSKMSAAELREYISKTFK